MTVLRLCAFGLLNLVAGLRAHGGTSTFVSNGHRIHMDMDCGSKSPAASVLVFLHGSGGPGSPGIPYRSELRKLTDEGYCVVVPHYLDETRGSGSDPIRHYAAWAETVTDCVSYIGRRFGTPVSQIALIGYSLGASVALAAGARNPRLAAVITISGSLPDETFQTMTALPPLLIVHGSDDQTIPVSNALQLANLCKDRNLVSALEVYAGESHRFSAAGRDRLGDDMEQFLKLHLPVAGRN